MKVDEKNTHVQMAIAPPTQLATTMTMIIALFDIPELLSSSFFSLAASAVSSGTADVSDVVSAGTVCVIVVLSTSAEVDDCAAVSELVSAGAEVGSLDEVGGRESIVEVVTTTSVVEGEGLRAEEMPDPSPPRRLPPPVVEEAED